MKMLNKIGLLFFLGAFIIGCQEDDTNFGAVTAPSNVSVSVTVQGQDATNPDGDGSGIVIVTSNADDALNYSFDFGDGRTASSYTGTVEHRFVQQGVNTYTIVVTATGTGGAATTQTAQVTVFSAFDDAEAVQLLTGGGTKTWYWAAAEPGHLGVGPNNGNPDDGNNFFPQFFSAPPFDKINEPCFYEDQLVFSLQNGAIKYNYLNNGQSYYNELFAGGPGTGDVCQDLDAGGLKDVTLVPSESIVPADLKRGTAMSFSDGGFMSYFVNNNLYDILSLTENRMEVRVIMNGDLAWYHIFTTEAPDPNAGSGGGTGTPTGSIVFSDEFDVDGAPDPANWVYDLGTGSNGWGNNEEQIYTDRTENIIVSDGTLKITARREAFGGRQFTSSRIKTEGLFDFTYGTIDFRAKLPSGGGTWPAIWSLGADYQTNPWPAAGEIDYMEHIGNNQDVVYATVHRPGASGGNADGNSIAVPNASTEFHDYRTIWTEENIRFFVDGELIHTVANNDNVPFNKDFFIIMNVAMGGNFGGIIDPAFAESTMEVDYIRVYQE